MDIKSIIESSQVNLDIKTRCLKVLEIYMSLASAQDDTAQKAGIFCAPACGECCTRDEPRISSIESEFAALWILNDKSGLASCFDSIHTRKHCIFFDPDSSLHCRIHAIRPLVCRIFHFCSFRNKSGTPVYRPCFVMKDKITVQNPQMLPVSEDYGWQLATLDPRGNQELLPVSEAVFDSYQKISFVHGLKSDSRYAK